MPHANLFMSFAAIVLATVTSAATAQPLPVNTKGIHDDKFRPPIVVSASFSQDNKRLAVSYYIYAQNRPGTDWRSFAATWDLESGKRVIIGGGMGPVAVSPDGQWLATGHYIRDPKDRSWHWSAAQLAVCKFGETEPAHRFVVGDPDKPKTPIEQREHAPNPVAIAFHPSNKHIAWLNQNGQVLLGNVEEKKQPVALAVTEIRENLLVGPYRDPNNPSLAFAENGTRLTLGLQFMKAGHQTTRTVKWKFDAAENKAESVSDEEVKGEKPEGSSPTRKRPADEPRVFHSPDKSIRVVAADSGVVELFKGDEKEPFKKLRLDD